MQGTVTALVSPDPLGTGQPPALVGGYPQSVEEGGGFDMTSLRAILWRQRWVLLLVTGAVMLGGLVLTMLMTPVYVATATVRVDPQNAEIIEGEELIDPYMTSNEIDRYLETLKSVIESRSMALKVADELDLHQSAAFLGEMADQAAPAGVSAQSWERERLQAAADALRGGLQVDLPMNSRVLSISYSDTDPQLAARVANAYTAKFLADNVERSVEANSYARQYLETEIAQVREKLRVAEEQAIQYARANRLIGQEPQISDTTGDIGTASTLTGTNLANVATLLSQARADRIQAEQRWRTVSAVPASQLPEVRENSTIQAMQTRLSELRSELSDLRVRYREDYPAVQGLRAEMATLEQQISSMGAEVKRSIRDEYQIARGREAELERDLQQLSNATLDEQDRRVQYNLISRDVAANREQLAILLQRFNQLASAANIQRSDATMIDSAVAPAAPSSPNLFTNLFLATVLGLGLAMAIAILREVFDDRMRSIDDVERKLRVPVLGQTPYVSHTLSDELDSVFSPISEAYSSIRATLDFALPRGSHPVIQFTSSQPGEGKTTSAVALASKFATLGRKVLLIDMDLRRPSVGKALGLEKAQVGVVDVLHARVPLERALVTTPVENLFVLPAGQIPHNPVEILSSGLLPEFLARYRRDFDVIVIDSSPVLGIADAPLLSRFVDGVVFVIEANEAHYGQVRQAVRRLRDVNANIIGTMLTKFRALEAGKDYNYQYQYYAYNEN